jgi:hypothetical protein
MNVQTKGCQIAHLIDRKNLSPSLTQQIETGRELPCFSTSFRSHTGPGINSIITHHTPAVAAEQSKLWTRLYFTIKLLLLVALPPFVVIPILPVLAPLGTTAVTFMSEFTVKVVALTPPKVTAVV